MMNLLLMVQDKPGPTPDQLAQMQMGFQWVGFVLMTTVLSISVLSALWMLTMVVAPDLTARNAAALRNRNFTSFAAGGGIAIGMLILAIPIQAVPIVGLPWVVMATILAVLGLTATSEDVGRRLFWACGRDGNRAVHILCGWTVTSLACAVPVLGWFVIAPYAVLSGVGSVAVGLFSGRPENGRRDPGVDLEIR